MYFAFALITPCMRLPFITPGKTAFTLILNFPNSIAAVCVNPIIAHLLDAYGERSGNPNIPAVEDILIIEPPLFFLTLGLQIL
jgi:hypothetical protein